MAPFYCAGGKKLPDGLWSDTRAIAFVTAVYGKTALVAIDEKVAVLNKDGTFEKIGYWFDQEGHYYSNLSWERKLSKKDEKGYLGYWENFPGIYNKGHLDAQKAPASVDKAHTTASPTGTYLSKEAEEANEACSLIVKKEKGNDKVVSLAVIKNTPNDMQIIGGCDV